MGLAAAVGNGGVAWLLWGPGQEHTAIRLAYVHNRGDVVLSCAPVVAGVLITLSGRGVFDAAMALGVAVWMCWSTLRELLVAPEELISPGTLSCGHASTGRISLRTKPSV
jgi:Co/Zn/Cd efflux system component